MNETEYKLFKSIQAALECIITRQGVLASMIAQTDIKGRKHTGMVNEMESMIDALVDYEKDLKRINGEKKE